MVVPFDGFHFPANCTALVYGGSLPIPAEPATDGFEQRFFLPREATRQGKIIQLVEASPQQRNHCAPVDFLTSCSFDWKGTLTFEFTRYLTETDLPPINEEDIPLPPGPGGGQTPPPNTPSTPGTPDAPADEDELLIPVPSRGKLSRAGDSASIKVTCASACSGTVAAFAAPRRGVRGSAARPLARKKFKARAGKPVTVKLRFRGAARKRLRKAGAVRLVVDAGGKKRSVVVRAG